MLTARDLTVDRGGRRILDAVSLTVGPLARIGIIGPNGIGKTTLLRILGGLDVPESGRVERAPANLTVGSPRRADRRAGRRPLRPHCDRLLHRRARTLPRARRRRVRRPRRDRVRRRRP